MRDDYKIEGETAKVEAEVEAKLATDLKTMADFTGLSLSEMVNTAIKRFIATHKDFKPR